MTGSDRFRQDPDGLTHKHCPWCDPKDYVIHTDEVPAWEEAHSHETEGK